MLQIKLFVLFLCILQVEISSAQIDKEGESNPKGLVKNFKDLDKKDLERLLNTIKKEQAAVIVKMKDNNLDNAKGVDLNSQLESLQKLQNLGPGDLFKSFFSDDSVIKDYSKQVYQMLDFFRNQSPQEVENLIAKTFTRGPMGSLFKSSPKAVTFLATLLRDEKALPNAAKIYGHESKNKIKIFLGILVFTFILSIVLKRKIGFLKRFCIIWGGRLAAFTILFGEFFLPICKIGMKTFF